jgi:hypothetical protein
MKVGLFAINSGKIKIKSIRGWSSTANVQSVSGPYSVPEQSLNTERYTLARSRFTPQQIN